MANSSISDELNDKLSKGQTKSGHVKPAPHNTNINSSKHIFSSPMLYKQWIDATKVDRKIRSSSLKSFDKAYEKYSRSKSFADMFSAQIAFSTWIRKKNTKSGWKASIRNKDGAAEIMYQQLFQGFASTPEGLPLWLPHLQGSEEQKAMDFWVQKSQQLCQRYFKPANGSLHLTLKKSSAAKSAYKELKALSKHIKKPKKPELGKMPSVNLPGVAMPNINVPQVRLPGMDLPNINVPQLNMPSVNLPCANLPNFDFPDAPQILVSLKNMIANFFGFENFLKMGNFLPEIMALIRLELGIIAGDFLTDMIPGVAQLKDGAKVVTGWGKVAYSIYNQQKAKSHGIYFNTGDAEKAFAAVHKLMKRETKALASNASIITAKIAGDALSAGVAMHATAIAKNIAVVCQRLFLLGLQWKEARAVNKILSGKKPLDYKIFSTAPITGSYLIAHGSLGDLLSMGRYQFGSKGWQDKVMDLDKKHIQPMRKTAKKQIESSIYSIPNFPHTVMV